MKPILVTNHRTKNSNAEEEISKFGLARTTLLGEYQRTIEMFESIQKEKGLYFALAFLYDSGYTNEDLGNMIEIMHPLREKNGFVEKTKVNYNLDDVIDGIQYGFDYRAESMNDGIQVPHGNSLQWLVARKGLNGKEFPEEFKKYMKR